MLRGRSRTRVAVAATRVSLRSRGYLVDLSIFRSFDLSISRSLDLAVAKARRSSDQEIKRSRDQEIKRSLHRCDSEIHVTPRSSRRRPVTGAEEEGAAPACPAACR